MHFCKTKYYLEKYTYYNKDYFTYTITFFIILVYSLKYMNYN